MLQAFDHEWMTRPRFFQGNIPFMIIKDMKESFPSDTIDHISEEAVEYSSTNVASREIIEPMNIGEE